MPVYKSQVFWHAIRQAVVGVIAILIILWSFFFVEWYKQRQITRERLSETSSAILDRLQMDVAETISSLSLGVAQATDDWVFESFEKDDLLIRVVSAEGHTLAGYDGLDAATGYSTVYLSHHDELDHHPLTALGSVFLKEETSTVDELYLIVARFYPYHLYEQLHNLRFISALVIPIGAILSLYIAYTTTVLVNRRLESLVSKTVSVSREGFRHRIPIATNADEFDQVAKEINTLTGRADALTKNMQDVTVGVAHDLKTPLSNISGRLQLIERDADNPESVLSHTLVANDHLQSLKRTLDAMLRLGEVEAGARRAAFSSVNLSVVVADMAETFAPVFEEADKVLDSDVQSGLTVSGDRELLMQLISNLLENALEHSRDGATAWIRLHRADSTVVLQIEDDGPGIPEQFSQKVFERFYRMDSSRGSAGNGLGLSLVKSIAQLHGGSSTLHSNGAGAVFTIKLPAS